MSKPIIATIIGDPAGVGPEVVVNALATGTPYEVSRPVLIGCTEAVEWAVGVTGTKFTNHFVPETNGPLCRTTVHRPQMANQIPQSYSRIKDQCLHHHLFLGGLTTRLYSRRPNLGRTPFPRWKTSQIKVLSLLISCFCHLSILSKTAPNTLFLLTKRANKLFPFYSEIGFFSGDFKRGVVVRPMDQWIARFL